MTQKWSILAPIAGFIEREHPVVHVFILVWVASISAFLWFGPGRVRGWLVLLMGYAILVMAVGLSSYLGGFTTSATKHAAPR